MFIQVTHAILVLLLVVGLPLWDRRETRLLRATPTAAVRIRSYQKVIAWLWAATVILLLTIPWSRLVTPALSAATLESFSTRGAFRVVSLGILGGLGVGITLPIVLGWLNPAARERLLTQFASIDFFLPASRMERRWFIAVCLSAGIGEEVIYRGFLFPWFAEGPLGLGIVAGGIAAAAAFGLAHGYQGLAGIISTGVIALLMTALFLVTGSLWIPMLVHVLMDLRILLIWPEEGLAAAAQE